MKKIIILFALIGIFILASAQQGCDSNTASRTGIDFNLISRTNFLTSGAGLTVDDSFYVGVNIENYDLEERSGLVCIRDNIDDGFGGISSESFGECQPFTVRQAETTTSKGGLLGGSSSSTTPGTVEVFFPQDREYSYVGMPEMLRPYTASLFVSLQYNEMTQATGTVTVPGTEVPTMAQQPAAIKVSAAKSIHSRSDGYKLDLDIDLIKQTVADIYLPDYSKGNFTYFTVQLLPLQLECTVLGTSVQGVVELKDMRTVKCSTIVYSKQDQSFPLIVTLSYGVILHKEFPFTITTQKT